MITCPECGQQTNNEAKFCDRCGQGLATDTAHRATTPISPLAPDTQLKGGYRIAELLSTSARENRYRAVRLPDNESVQLREQPAPIGQPEAPAADETGPAPSDEDPAGPHAKTAELRLERSQNPTSTNGSNAQRVEPERENQPATSKVENTAGPELSCWAPEDASKAADPAEEPGEASVHVLTEEIEESSNSTAGSTAETPVSELPSMANRHDMGDGQEQKDLERHADLANDDLGEVFGRVLALSKTLKHPAFQRAADGFADHGRVYLVYPDEQLRPLSSRPGGLRMGEGEALHIAIQVCQAVNVVHRRGLRVNDICPDSIGYAPDGRIKLTGLDYLTNDNELQSEPLFNDGYTAPEIYRGKKADKRADVFSIGALLYSCITGERLDSETWREEAGPIRFYPPHVVTPALEHTLRRALQFDPGARWPNVEALKAELVKLAATVRLRADAFTDVGRIREHNEDSVLALEYESQSLIHPEQIILYVVADGMGGAEAGEVASAIAVQRIRNYVEEKLGGSESINVGAILLEALEQANSSIIEYQAAHPEARSMGSTAVAALVRPPEAAIAWVGDSRAYIYDGHLLRQVTKDHSLVQRLIEIGQISPEQARHHEHKNVITRSLGARPTGPAGAESVSLRLKRGDRLLLCSDGLTTHVEDRQIAEILHRHSDPTAAALELVVAANAGGGTDNISVVVTIAG
ncbi:MAG: Stp1/IreP family PP2C-type Ser/Thr phosphatase [Deltaproteobacteria bacterium]|nr:Stp1/IreP family PP2C-type Ser/Thr phosphatase [Deltaproteobacteria bacterium]